MTSCTWLLNLLLLIRLARAAPQPQSLSPDVFNSVMSVGESVLHDIYQATAPLSETVQTSSSRSQAIATSLLDSNDGSIQSATSRITQGPSRLEPSRSVAEPTSIGSSGNLRVSQTDTRSTYTKVVTHGQATHTASLSASSNSKSINFQDEASNDKDIIIAVSAVCGILLMALCITTVWVCILRPKRYQHSADDEKLLGKNEKPLGKDNSSRGSVRPPSITDPDAPAFAERPLQPPESAYQMPFTQSRYYSNGSSDGDQLVSPLEEPTNAIRQPYQHLKPIPDAREDSLPPSPVEMEGDQTWPPWIPRKSSKRVGPQPVPPKIVDSYDADFGFPGRRSPVYDLRPTYNRGMSRQHSERFSEQSFDEEQWPLDRWGEY